MKVHTLVDVAGKEEVCASVRLDWSISNSHMHVWLEVIKFDRVTNAFVKYTYLNTQFYANKRLVNDETNVYSWLCT